MVEAQYLVDPNRMDLTGWSYGAGRGVVCSPFGVGEVYKKCRGGELHRLAYAGCHPVLIHFLWSFESVFRQPATGLSVATGPVI